MIALKLPDENIYLHSTCACAEYQAMMCNLLYKLLSVQTEADPREGFQNSRELCNAKNAKKKKK